MESEMKVKDEKWGITGSTLKLIAIIAMFIDHFAAIILERLLVQRGMDGIVDQETAMAFMEQNVGLYYINLVLRLVIGRLAFPIFCFLLVEGFLHTRNLKKYVLRMFLFALVSEVPFNLAFTGKLWYWQYQNVFFTLLIGLLVIIGMRFVQEKREWNKAVRMFLPLVFLLAGMTLAGRLMTDYGMFGVLTVVAVYLFRNKKTLSAGAGCAVLTAMSLSEIAAFFALIPIHLYNGKRGWNIKWLFYVFYPLHIFLLYLLAWAMGLGQIIIR